MTRKWLWIGAAALAVAVLYLPTLGVGLGQIAVFLLVLLCPLMHLLGGHRHGAGGAERTEPSKPEEPAVRPAGQER